MILGPAVAVAFAIVTLPGGDVTAMVQHPSPRAAIRLAADIAGSLPSPHARLAAFALGLLAAGNPSNHPLLDAQTSLGRAGRRA